MDLSVRQTIIAAILIFFLGKYINRRVKFLQNYNIPEPVTGGILASLFFWLLHALFAVDVTFHMGTRDILLLTFFTTIGLSARFKTLKEGGISLVILLVAAVTYLFIQNLTGVTIAKVMGVDGIIGLLSGSISLSGGHGTAIAWAQKLAGKYQLQNAAEIGVACATFGLVLGGLIGGPIAHFLIKRHQLQPVDESGQLTVGFSYNEELPKIDVEAILASILLIALAVGLAIQLKPLILSTGIDLPDFVICLFAGIILTNTAPYIFPRLAWPAGSAAMALIADLSLGLFLTMSLMSLQLWSLLGLAGPIVAILVAQTTLIVLFSIFVVFRLLGRNYDAAVIVSGYAGLAMGATPTAIANMTAVTERFGPAPKAFIVVPLVGAFFIDIANAGIIEIFLRWLR
ncbi:MAG: sodium/glutamate symporter [Deltaproteobacteria bacterium]|nr:sodium/glutamate symporter [Deltaproteobacteria bacterium]